ncbi:hypothetical protein [Cellulomonas iranensis]|uniref:hypothetical protein n=1 Tax=Cellulomonas iranensis TaxID=76862 RepID=UPI0013D863BC|nr:hypothetical protein [Cellulomonas iranensis]
MAEQITTPEALDALPVESIDREALLARMDPESWLSEDGDWLIDPESDDFFADAQALHALAARQPAPVGPDLAAIATTLGATTGWSRDAALAVLRALAEPARADAETDRVPAAAACQHARSARGAAAAVVAQQVAREEAHVRLDAVGADLDVLAEVAAYGVPASDLLAFVRGYSRGGVDQRVTVVPVPGHPSRELVLHAGGRVSWRDAPGCGLAAERAVLEEEPEVRRG